jgi:hypothetical protein
MRSEESFCISVVVRGERNIGKADEMLVLTVANVALLNGAGTWREVLLFVEGADDVGVDVEGPLSGSLV